MIRAFKYFIASSTAMLLMITPAFAQSGIAGTVRNFDEEIQTIIKKIEDKNTPSRRTALAWILHDAAQDAFSKLLDKPKASQFSKDQHLDALSTAYSYSKKATELNQDTAEFWRLYGAINMFNKGGPISAIEAEGAFLRVLEIMPTDLQARKNLITIFMQSGDYDSAIPQFQFLMNNHPDYFTQSQLDTAFMAYTLSEHTYEGVNDVKAMLMRKPALANANLLIAMLQRAQGDHEASLQTVKMLYSGSYPAPVSSEIKQRARQLEQQWKTLGAIQ